MNMEEFTQGGRFCAVANSNVAVDNEEGYFETLKEAKQSQRYPWKNVDPSDFLLDDSDYSPMFMTF